MHSQSRNLALPFWNLYSGFIALILSLGFLFLFVRLYEDRTGLTYLFLLMLVQVTPFCLSYASKNYNFISFVLVNHFITYSMAKYNQLVSVYKTNALSPQAMSSIQELTFCSILMIFAYWVARQYLLQKVDSKPRLSAASLSKPQLWILGLYVCSHTLFLDFLPNSLRTIHFVTSAAALVLLLCSESVEHRFLLFFFKCSAFMATGYYFIKTASLAKAGSLAGILFMITAVQRKPRYLFLLLLLAFIMSAVQPVKANYRELLKEHPEINFVGRITLLCELLFIKYWEREPIDDVEKDNVQTLFKGFSRIGDDSMERVLAWTPSRVPFWEGESYANIPFMFIPRILWPDKPTWNLWNKFGRTYGFLSSDDFTTSVGVGYLGEGYMNFGFLGMYVVALIFGSLIAFVERMSYAFLGGGYQVTFICFLIPVITYAGDLGSVVNSIILMIGVLFLLRPQLLKMVRKDLYSD